MKLNFKKLLVIWLALALLLGMAACGSTGTETEPTAPESTPAPETSEPITVQRIRIVQEPDRLDYEEGEMFDPTGVVINATLSDGSVMRDVPFELATDSPLTRDTTAVTFTYEGKSVEQKINITFRGNRMEYSASLVPKAADSPLEGKVIFWLGSSVTAGASSGQESMVEFIAQKYGADCIKEAVGGTLLADVYGASYVSRFNKYLASDNRAEHLDAFVCQLSTNDKGVPQFFGVVTAEDVRDPAAFDTATTFGAIEYIIATVKETWGCPVFFYTSPPMGNDNYGVMVDALEEIAAKWDITIIDMYRDEAFNDLTEEELLLYMADDIHPTKAGYRDWWLPKFEEALSGI